MPHKHAKVKQWLAWHPRYHADRQFMAESVERFFADITQTRFATAVSPACGN
jgi:hypothetical protein